VGGFSVFPSEKGRKTSEPDLGVGLDSLCNMSAHLYSRVLTCSALLWFAQNATADWITPYDVGDTPDLILRYVGPVTEVVSPDASAGTGITYNNTPETGSGAGADLYVQGSAAVSLLGSYLVKTNSQVAVGGGAPGLRFDTVTDGALGQLVGVTPTITWRATSEIVGSNAWDTYGSTSYRYVFDLYLNNSLLGGLGVDLFNGVSLTISAGGNILYQATGLTTILGLPSIVNSFYNDVTVQFTYDQSLGPIVVQWEASSLLSANLLSGLGTGTNNVFSFDDARLQVDAIPEPGALALLTGAGVLLGLRRRR